MKIFRTLLIALIFVSTSGLLAQNSEDSLSQDQIRELIRQSADRFINSNKARRNYTYIERDETHKLNGKGEVKSTEIQTHEVMFLYEEPVWKLIAKDDKPLPEKDAKKEDEKLQKIIDKRKSESEDDRKKRTEKEEKQHDEIQKFVNEIPDAYNFRLANMENFEGRETYVIDADPRADFQPQRKEAKMLPKFRFRVWIDKAEKQWVKIDIQCIDTVSVGLFLARIHKGTNIQIERTRVNDEVWLPKHITLKLDARIVLLMGLNLTEDITYRDYKKFRTDTIIVPLGEVQEH